MQLLWQMLLLLPLFLLLFLQVWLSSLLRMVTVSTALLQVPTDREAMEILKRVEESASSIRDPTAYVVSAVRRIINEKGGR
eukprot:s123_g25.t1